MLTTENPGARLQQWLGRLSDRFIRLPATEIDAAIVEGLREIVEYLDVDRSTVFDISTSSPDLSSTHTWARPGLTPFPRDARLSDFPWLQRQLEEGRTVALNRLPDDLPIEAEKEREHCQSSGLLSNLTIPILVNGRLTCSLSIGALRKPITWSPEIVDLLQLAGQILAAALYRNRQEREVETARELARDFFDSLDSMAAVLDHEGCTVGVNRAWRKGDLEISGLFQQPLADDTVGTNYVQLLEASAAGGNMEAARAAAGIRGVLAGEESVFLMEYPHTTPSGVRWALMRVLRREGHEGGAILMHLDVTERVENTRRLEHSLDEVARLHSVMKEEKLYLQEEIKLDHDFENIIGRSAALRSTLSRIERVAPTGATVLLLGETGTGKELFAHAIHDSSARGARALIKVNCAALPSSLIESELFGHVKGAFTGAVANKKGRFELADGGSLFLDEIGDLDLDLQAKLLRVLQSGEFERVGEARTVQVDVRVIAATHRNLASMMARGVFREDLFHRLTTFPVEVPPLRKRREDIPLLVWHFLESCELEWGRQIESVPAPVMESLQSYSWPGNIRELKNVIERAVILSPGDELLLDPGSLGPVRTKSESSPDERLDTVQRDHISRVLESCGWRINGPGNAAERLGIHPNTLRHRLKKLGIERPR